MVVVEQSTSRRNQADRKQNKTGRRRRRKKNDDNNKKGGNLSCFSGGPSTVSNRLDNAPSRLSVSPGPLSSLPIVAITSRSTADHLNSDCNGLRRRDAQIKDPNKTAGKKTRLEKERKKNAETIYNQNIKGEQNIRKKKKVPFWFHRLDITDPRFGNDMQLFLLSSRKAYFVLALTLIQS